MAPGQRDSPEQQLGSRIRMVRTARRLSLRALAAATSTSPGFLSELERGHVNASIATLRRIAEALGMTLPDLFSAESLHEHKVLRRADRVEIHASPEVSKYLITRPPLLNLEVYVGEFRPGATAGEPYVHGDSQEILLVQRGCMTLVLGDEEFVLHEGDSAEYRTNVVHTVRNDSDADAEITWIVSPPTTS